MLDFLVDLRLQQFTFSGVFFSFAFQRNLLASLFAIILASCLFRPKSQSVASGLVIVISALLLVFSGSRTAQVQFASIASIFYFYRRGAAFFHFRAGLLILVYYLFLLYTFLGSGNISSNALLRITDATVYCQSRLTLWSNVLTLIAQKPLLGWGWNELDYAHFITLYPGERFCDILDNAHNLPLHLAVELGLPVALAFCGLFVWWIARNKPWRETDATRQTCWAILMVIGIHSLLEYPLWYAPFQITTLICLLILWQTRPDKAATPGLFLRIESVLIRGRILISASLLVVCAFAAWNYHVVSQIYLPAEERSAAYRVGTLEKVQGTLLFQNHARFAKLTLTPLTLDNASSINALAKEMLHHSPEPRVIEPLVESAVMLGRQDEALYYLQRYKAAFPTAYEQWVAKNGLRASSASAATHSP